MQHERNIAIKCYTELIKKWTPDSVTHSRKQIAIFASFICNFDTASIPPLQLRRTLAKHHNRFNKTLRPSDTHSRAYLDSVIQKILQFSFASSSSTNSRQGTWHPMKLYYILLAWNETDILSGTLRVVLASKRVLCAFCELAYSHSIFLPTNFSFHVKEVDNI